ncbi:energy transducer TonB [Shewanella intestini]|uniref:Energy transducer TonB n=1 Tax=Shewanella intestini TaxID=2017544 RepID=A0ABS5I0J6_9GAMM|nr:MULTISPECIES: energy transducer TonB [Shewanella]MBR9726910.1 energy transducer TonB [Shewanella intestini]MRG34524.1 TonB family protein [Shewanella sp. XMDDZSB0408]
MVKISVKQVAIWSLRIVISIAFTVLCCFYLPRWLNDSKINYQQQAKTEQMTLPMPKVVKKTEVTHSNSSEKSQSPQKPLAVVSVKMPPINQLADIAFDLPLTPAPKLNSMALPQIGSVIASVKDVDQPPEIVKYIQPKMPTAGRKYKQGGKVLLRLIIEANGSVSHAEVLKSTPKAIFDNAAMVAARKWRFKPAVLSGETVQVYVDVPISFKVN